MHNTASSTILKQVFWKDEDKKQLRCGFLGGQFAWRPSVYRSYGPDAGFAAEVSDHLALAGERILTQS